MTTQIIPLYDDLIIYYLIMKPREIMKLNRLELPTIVRIVILWLGQMHGIPCTTISFGIQIAWNLFSIFRLMAPNILSQQADEKVVDPAQMHMILGIHCALLKSSKFS